MNFLSWSYIFFSIDSKIWTLPRAARNSAICSCQNVTSLNRQLYQVSLIISSYCWHVVSCHNTSCFTRLLCSTDLDYPLFTCLCLLCSFMLQLGWSLLVPLQFCCYELGNTRLRGVVQPWLFHKCIWTTFFFTKARGEKSFQCIPQSLWTAQCLSRPENALLSQGVCIPPIPVITAGGPGRGDQNLTWVRGHKQQSGCAAQNWAMENLTWLFKSTLICCTESRSSHKSPPW